MTTVQICEVVALLLPGATTSRKIGRAGPIVFSGSEGPACPPTKERRAGSYARPRRRSGALDLREAELFSDAAIKDTSVATKNEAIRKEMQGRLDQEGATQ